MLIKKLGIAVLFGLLTTVSVFGQEQYKELTNELIWGMNSPFRMESVDEVRSMNDGIHFTALDFDPADGLVISKYSFKDYEKVGVIAKASDMVPEGAEEAITIQSYEFNADETKLLVATNIRSIYRRSFTATYYIYDIEENTTTPLSENGDRQRLTEFSPNGKKIAFVRENNIYVVDLESGDEKQVTTDGKLNEIINGATDWVYEEEFAITKGFHWSPNSDMIAFYRFDETEVPEFQMAFYGKLYPHQYKFKYPKAGEKNSIVTLHVYDFRKDEIKQLDTGSEMDQYIPRFKWTNATATLCALRMNRHQSKLEYIFYNLNLAKTGPHKWGDPEVIYTEESDRYIEIDDNLLFLADNSFIRTSEKNGYNHIYRIYPDGKSKQITMGNWDVVEFKGIDRDKELIYYTSAEEGAMYKALYVIGLNGKGKNKLSEHKGTNDAVFSKGMKYYINYFSDANTPLFITLHKANGKDLKVLEDNAKLKNKMAQFNLQKKEFLTVDGADGKLNAWMIKPPNFDASKEYPVYLFVYGGPGHNTVLDQWGGRNFFYHQLLAQQGYIVISVDPRGTMYRGEDFKKSTYLQLGKNETEDMIAAAKWMKKQPFIDGDRIGVQGWSYGGYMTLLCLTKGAEHFACGISVAPVTNWRFYDTIYTERFMQTPQENADGYDTNSPINHVEELEDPLLLVHGSGDDNVHHQNSLEMVDALVKANKQFDLFIYPNKNHGIYGGNTRLHLYNMMLEFTKENL